jgi:hypothetical protein
MVVATSFRADDNAPTSPVSLRRQKSLKALPSLGKLEEDTR